MTQLNNNTSTLQEILSVVNNLPESGGGTALETCQVTVTSSGGSQITYVSGLAETDRHKAETVTGTKTLTVVKGTTIFFSAGFSAFLEPWTFNLCFANGEAALAFVTQDCSVTLNS